MKDWKGKVALITGASSGIGAATALRLARSGLEAALVARREDRLLQLKRQIEASGGKARIIVADLSAEEERVSVFRQAGPVDILVNNAGFGWYGYFSDMPWETAQEMIHINDCAAVHLARLFLPGMLERGYGHIVNVGSISGSIPSQGIAMYSASKSFLDAFTTALHRETRGTGVQVSIVRAGPVRTEFGQAALTKSNGRHVPTEKFGAPPGRVAQRIWDLLQRPRRVSYAPGWMAVVPWLELGFGWLEDRLGPLLLRHDR